MVWRNRTKEINGMEQAERNINQNIKKIKIISPWNFPNSYILTGIQSVLKRNVHLTVGLTVHRRN
jgi:hypothetical protein